MTAQTTPKASQKFIKRPLKSKQTKTRLELFISVAIRLSKPFFLLIGEVNDRKLQFSCHPTAKIRDKKKNEDIKIGMDATGWQQKVGGVGIHIAVGNSFKLWNYMYLSLHV